MKRTVYLILFRGVGGKTQLPIQALREKLAESGFENVATYINSGNAIVRSRMSRKKVIATIAELCRTQFGFDKAIFAPTLAEWDEVIARNPFPKAAANAPTTVHAALLESAPKIENVERVGTLAVKGEAIKVIEGVAYLHTPHGFGPSVMREKFDRWIGVTYTARNWNTVLKLAELGRAAEHKRRGSATIPRNLFCRANLPLCPSQTITADRGFPPPPVLPGASAIPASRDSTPRQESSPECLPA
jgi:uncharacterized protein (DUF1697 family)